MSKDDAVYMANYFFRDYITEDIMSYCIGEVYLYHYKENLIGVRDMRNQTAYFLNTETIPAETTMYPPTIKQITEEHIKDSIDEIDRGNEKLVRLDISDLVTKAREVIAAEIANDIDTLLTDGNR